MVDINKSSSFPLLDRIPKELSGKMNHAIKIFDVLCSMNISNFEEKCRIVKNSDFSTTLDDHQQFLRFSLNVSFFWPFRIPVSSKLIKYLIDNESENKFYGMSKDIVLKQLTHWYFNDSNDDVYIFDLYYLLTGITLNIIKPSEVVKSIEKVFRTKRQFLNQICMLFLYFAPEIQSENPELFDKLYAFYKRSKTTNGHLYPKTIAFFEDYDNLKENNWEKLKEIRIREDCGDPILRSILEDDLILFLKSITNNDGTININGYFVNPPLSVFTLLDVKFPYILVAAVFNSKKIFSYLIEAGANLDLRAESGATLVQSIALCPQQEILEILREKNVTINYKEGMTGIVRCFDTSLYEQFVSLFLSNFDNFEGLSPTQSTVLVQSVLCSNYKTFKMCLEKNANVNEPDGSGTTPISLACQIGNLTMAKILIELGADIKKTYPLHQAASCGHLEIMKYLLGLPDIDVDQENDHDVTDFIYIFFIFF